MPDWPPTHRSDDGRIEVRYDAQEMRMSIWVMSPTVLYDGREIVSLPYPWSCEQVTFPAPDQVTMELRRYPNGSLVTPVAVDVAAERFSFPDEPDDPQPFSALESALHAYRKRQRAR